MAFDPCVSCHEVEGKYKCPQCTQRTCSVPCSKKHKESHPPQDAAGVEPVTNNIANGSTASEKPQNANQLADMPEYKMLMNRYPQLLSQLSDIAAATDPPSDTASSVSGSGTSGSARYSGKKQEPWTPDIGIQKGMEVLKSARQARGADSEGIREFIELHRLWQTRQQAAATADQARTDEQAAAAAAAAARKELAQADARAIQELLEKEKSSAK